MAVFLYFVIFSLGANLAQISMDQSNYFENNILVLLRVISEFLIIIPIIFPIARIGILHPLVFPFFLSLAKEFGSNPLSLIRSFYAQSVTLVRSSAFDATQGELLTLNIFDQFLNIGWILSLYAGFFLLKNLSVSRWRIIKPKNKQTFLLASFVGFLICLIFFQLQGGILAWISAWGVGGRRAAMEGFGPILRLLLALYLIPLVWFSWYGNKVFRQPLFIISFLIFTFVGFAAVGSRSSIFYAILSFLVLWVIKNKTIPFTSIALSGVLVFILFGLLGQIRSAATFTRNGFDTRRIDFSIQGSLNYANNETEMWQGLGTDLAIYKKVPEDVGFLFGKTYVGSILFFIPRIIWPNKPHGAGYYCGKFIFGGTAGVPPSATGEAYWNFSFFGIIFLGFLNGVFMRWLSNTHFINHDNPTWRAIYSIILTTAIVFSSIGMTGLLQKMIWVILGLKFMRLL